MKKIMKAIIAVLLISILCITLTACKVKCKEPGCRNDPVNIFGVRSEYCVLHVVNELR